LTVLSCLLLLDVNKPLSQERREWCAKIKKVKADKVFHFEAIYQQGVDVSTVQIV
jgi:hypothetical protein